MIRVHHDLYINSSLYRINHNILQDVGNKRCLVQQGAACPYRNLLGGQGGQVHRVRAWYLP